MIFVSRCLRLGSAGGGWYSRLRLPYRRLPSSGSVVVLTATASTVAEPATAAGTTPRAAAAAAMALHMQRRYSSSVSRRGGAGRGLRARAPVPGTDNATTAGSGSCGGGVTSHKRTPSGSTVTAASASSSSLSTPPVATSRKTAAAATTATATSAAADVAVSNASSKVEWSETDRAIALEALQRHSTSRNNRNTKRRAGSDGIWDQSPRRRRAAAAAAKKKRPSPARSAAEEAAIAAAVEAVLNPPGGPTPSFAEMQAAAAAAAQPSATAPSPTPSSSPQRRAASTPLSTVASANKKRRGSMSAGAATSSSSSSSSLRSASAPASASSPTRTAAAAAAPASAPAASASSETRVAGLPHSASERIRQHVARKRQLLQKLREQKLAREQQQQQQQELQRPKESTRGRGASLVDSKASARAVKNKNKKKLKGRAAVPTAGTSATKASASTPLTPAAAVAASARAAASTSSSSSTPSPSSTAAAAAEMGEIKLKTPAGGLLAPTKNPLLVPDYRERIFTIFQQFADINMALGEKYKTQSYLSAIEKLKKDDHIFNILPPNVVPLPEGSAPRIFASTDPQTLQDCLDRRKFALDESKPIPGVGDKLRKKIVEILKTGDVQEIHKLEAKPIIRAIQELTKIHGVGPRTAIAFYKQFGVTTVEELKAYAEKHDAESVAAAAAASEGKTGQRGRFKLTDAQRIGLKYHKEIMQRIPHAEGRVHEALLKMKLKKCLGSAYELTVCGSYRREVAFSGDIDVLVTRRQGGGSGGKVDEAAEKDVLGVFVEALKTDNYIEATLAHGPTKFMGVCRIRSSKKKDGAAVPTRRFAARRLDIRFVDSASYPAALLYFTGSKNFNVVMRAEAIKQNFVLNEYGLFRNNSKDARATHTLHELISKLAKTHYYGSKSARGADEDGEDGSDGDGSSSSSNSGGRGSRLKKAKKTSSEKETQEAFQKVEALRVKVASEKDIFDAIGMAYVAPTDRNV